MRVTAQTLSVSFTPTDSIDYTNATAAATINVEKATPTIAWTDPAEITYGAPCPAHNSTRWPPCRAP